MAECGGGVDVRDKAVSAISGVRAREAGEHVFGCVGDATAVPVEDCGCPFLHHLLLV